MNPEIMITFISSSVILVRTVCLAAKMSARNFKGHPLRFAAIAAANSFLAAGAVGVVLDWSDAAILLLVGAALKLVSDRRNGK